jgi:hypothetical protein
MKPKKPSPLFEVRFEGPGIYPERIPSERSRRRDGEAVSDPTS